MNVWLINPARFHHTFLLPTCSRTRSSGESERDRAKVEVIGSNPIGFASFFRGRPRGFRTSDFESENVGSIPSPGASNGRDARPFGRAGGAIAS